MPVSSHFFAQLSRMRLIYRWPLMRSVQPENISGEFRDGMLYVHMTKSTPSSAQPLEIEIK